MATSRPWHLQVATWGTMGRYVAVRWEQAEPPQPCHRPGGMDHPRKRAAVDDSSQQWRDTGSNSGQHLQAVTLTAQQQAVAAVDAAYDAFFAHAHDCAHCRTQGVDCETAAGLRMDIRKATAAAK